MNNKKQSQIRILRNKAEVAFRLLYINYFSKFIPTILITEFPKSGGTWLGQLIASYLELPFPRNRFPKLRPSVFHGHYLPIKKSKNLKKILWLVRDGRDVMVSHYFHSLIWNDKNVLIPNYVNYTRKKMSFDDYDNVKKNLPEFIKYSFEHVLPRSVYFTRIGNWATFNHSWLEYRKNNQDIVYMVKYESLLENTEKELQRILIDAFDIKPSPEKISHIVNTYAFETQTQRPKGDEDSKSFLRKGISGDWKNNFSEEAEKLFNSYAREMLENIGYEVEG
jgi:hypothetical protein